MRRHRTRGPTGKRRSLPHIRHHHVESIAMRRRRQKSRVKNYEPTRESLPDSFHKKSPFLKSHATVGHMQNPQPPLDAGFVSTGTLAEERRAGAVCAFQPNTEPTGGSSPDRFHRASPFLNRPRHSGARNIGSRRWTQVLAAQAPWLALRNEGPVRRVRRRGATRAGNSASATREEYERRYQ